MTTRDFIVPISLIFSAVVLACGIDMAFDGIDETVDLGTEVNQSIQDSMDWAAAREQEILKTNKLLAPLCAKSCENLGGKFANYDSSKAPQRRCTCTMKDEMLFFHVYEQHGRGTRIKWKEQEPKE